MHCACTKDRNMYICSQKCSARVPETLSRRTFSKVSRRGHHICEAASRTYLRNQGAICKNDMCTRESMAESIVRTPAKPSSSKRRCFQMFKKAYHEKWPFITIDEKGDTCLNSEVHSTVVKCQNYFIFVGICLLMCS